LKRLARVLAGVMSLALAWAFVLALTGGFRFDWGPIRISSRDPWNALALAELACLGLLALLVFDNLRVAAQEDQPTLAQPAGRSDHTPIGARSLRGVVVLAVTAGYFAYVFQFHTGLFLKSGLGDWLDPYFINFLQEHWLNSLLHLSAPGSPSMYYPVPGTLGYSHGLVLYAPFYLAVRAFLDPFPAYTVALFLVMTTGSVSLYVWLRRIFALSALEALLLSVFFFSSANVINSGTNTWSQRASVFLIPTLGLLTHYSVRIPDGRRQTLMSGLAGCLSALLLTQDIYTALFVVLLGALLAAPVLLAPSWRAARASLVRAARTMHGRAYGLGALLGTLLFLSFYLSAFLQHPSFPAEDLTNALIARHPSGWQGPLDVVRDLRIYDTPRSFLLAVLLAVVAWTAGSHLDGAMRRYAAWFLCVTALVIVVPFSFGTFSPWKTFFAPVPAFSAIRDPRRIIYLYELAAVVVAAWYLRDLAPRSFRRALVVGVIGLLLATHWNPSVFVYRRSVNAFNDWVRAPIAIERSCASFFIKGASADYMGRAGDMWGLYNIDTMFIALATSIPTLNGYSAWTPDGWGLAHPNESGYLEAVDRWIERYELRNVCALDIDARTMTPYVPAVKVEPVRP
jgi:hypothetical protein